MTTILHGNIIHAPSFGALETVPNGYLILEDGVLQTVSPVLPEQYAGAPVEDFGNALILQSLADLHLHAPQYPMLGSGMDLPLMPLSIRIAMTVGMAISMTASTMTNSGESRLAVRYSRRDFANVLMTCALEGVVSVAVVVLMLPHLLSAGGVWWLAWYV